MMKVRAFSILKITCILVLGISMLFSSASLGVLAEGDGFFLSENYAAGKNISVNNAYSKAPKECAIDEDRTSFWRTNSTYKDDFIYFIISLGKPTDVNVAHLVLYDADRMCTVKLQYTTDASPSPSSEWHDIKVLQGAEIKSIITVGFDTVKATGIRFYADLSKKAAGLYEFQVYYTNDTAVATEKLNNIDFKSFTQPKSVDAEIVSVGKNGELVYADYDGNGSALIDYSYAGYKNGEKEIPNVKVVKTIEPGDYKDHTTLIQNAIDEIAALPEKERGAILLKKGKYTVSNELFITASGIVLRGEGQGENGTVIYDTRTESEASTLRISGARAYSVVAGTKSTLVGSVPTGATELPLSAVHSYAVGDAVRVVCSPNDLWIKTLGMDVIPGDGVKQWKPSQYVLTYERWITAIDAANKTVTINTGIPTTLDEKYFAVTVEKIVDSDERITECGIENIRFLSHYNGLKTDEDHAWIAIDLYDCRNCWVRDVTAKHYAYATVRAGSNSINVTVEGCSYLEPISTVSGGRRDSFCIDGGQYILVKNCYSYDSRHDYVVQEKGCGPNVFLDCVAEDSNSVSEPHHRWSSGILFDNVYQIGRLRLGYFEAVNRGNSGTGHGWSGVSTVFWNCLSPAIVVGKPQTEQNFAVGVHGIFDGVGKSDYLSMYNKGFVVPSVVTPNYPETTDYEASPMYGNAYVESPYNPVNPSSLYRAQLAYRLAGDATKHIAPNAPILEYPMADSKTALRSVVFSGIRDQNAEKVYVCVDGKKYEAKLSNDGSYAYSVEITLENGYHDVSVTQVVNGIESASNATRTILVDSDDPFVPPETVPDVTVEAGTEATEPDVTVETGNGGDDAIAPSGETDFDGMGEENKASQKENGTKKGFVIILIGVAAAVIASTTGVAIYRMRKKKKGN